MSFAAAAWLWSGFALLFPVALHLLGRGRGVRRRWPSVRLLREAALASGARWRPSRPWLLLLRCLLLAAVTLALAGPSLARRPVAGTIWLVEPSVEVDAAVDLAGPGTPGGGREVGTAGSVQGGTKGRSAPGRPEGRAAVRLPAAGPPAGATEVRGLAAAPAGDAEVRLLAAGLPEVPVPRSAGSPPAVERRSPAPGAAAVLAERREAGCSPDLWSLLAEADASLPAGKDFVVIARPRLAVLCGSRPALGRAVSWRRPAGAPAVAAPLPARRPMSLWIEAAPERAADAAALRGGLARGAAALGWLVEEAAGAATADLLVSLGREAPAAWQERVEHGATLLRDGGGALVPCTSLVATRCCGLFPRMLCPAESADAFAGEPAGQAVWRDGAGHAVLGRERRGAGAVLRFAGRFAPDASGPGRGAFADLLRAARGTADTGAGAVEASLDQALPRRAAVSRGASGLPLERPLWLLVAMLLAAERWAARRVMAREDQDVETDGVEASG